MLPLFVEIKMKESNPKTITVSDEVMDNLENAFKKLRKQGMENEKNTKNEKYFVPFSNKQLKDVFGLTDRQILKIHNRGGYLQYSPTKQKWVARFKPNTPLTKKSKFAIRG